MKNTQNNNNESPKNIRDEISQAYKYGFKLLLNRKIKKAPTIEVVREKFARSPLYKSQNDEQNENLFSHLIQGLNRTIITKFNINWIMTGTFKADGVLTEKNQRTQLYSAIKLGLVNQNLTNAPVSNQVGKSIAENIIGVDLSDHNDSEMHDLTKETLGPCVNEKVQGSLHSKPKYSDIDSITHKKGYELNMSFDIMGNVALYNKILQQRFYTTCARPAMSFAECQRLYKIFIEAFKLKISKTNYGNIHENQIRFISDELDDPKINRAPNNTETIAPVKEIEPFIRNDLNLYKANLKVSLKNLTEVVSVKDSILSLMNRHVTFRKYTKDQRESFLQLFLVEDDIEEILSKLRVVNPEKNINPVNVSVTNLSVPNLSVTNLSEPNSVNLSEENLPLPVETQHPVALPLKVAVSNASLLREKADAFREGAAFADLNSDIKLDDDSLMDLLGTDYSEVYKKAFLVGYHKRTFVQMPAAKDIEEEKPSAPKKMRFV